jgi:hypothetical protein
VISRPKYLWQHALSVEMALVRCGQAKTHLAHPDFLTRAQFSTAHLQQR